MSKRFRSLPTIYFRARGEALEVRAAYTQAFALRADWP